MNNVKQYLGKRSTISALVWGATYITVAYVLKHAGLSKPIGITIAILPVITFVFFIYTYIKSISAMDEVRQRIQLEAAVIGFSLSLLLLIILFLLSMCDVSDFDWFGYPQLVCYCMLFYYIGYFISKRKYAA